GGGRAAGPWLGEVRVEVGFEGVVAQEELGRDLRVGQPAGDQAEDLYLPLGQAIRGRRRPARVRLRRRRRGGQQRGVRPGVEDRQAARRRLQRLGDVGAVGILGHVAA